MAQEFLPFCDVLFNIISLASYFCDIVFDVITVYTLYANNQFWWFVLSLSCIMLSLLASQLMSLKWYFRRRNSKELKHSVVAIIHVLQFGVLWRYFKLFLPVDLGFVKNEVRDLCMLRLIHAFCEAAPMLLIQLFLIWLKSSSMEVSDLNVVSTVFSLFSVCWALASFSKNVRHRNIHRLVLTWLGVIFQFCWRVGTVSSRVVALTVYATLYHYWVFLVIILHWLSMLLWLVSPKNVFHGERISLKRKMAYSILIAFVYIFCYINLQEINARQKMMAFYITMFLENTLLMAVFLGLRGQTSWFHGISVAVVWGGFSLGIFFMIIYYRFFHIQRLKNNFAVGLDVESRCLECTGESCNGHLNKANMSEENKALTSEGDARNNFALEKCKNSAMFCSSNGHFQNGMSSGIPGVFNCRLNPAFKRKKKKPSTFVPPPPPVPALSSNGKTCSPFWKKPPIKTCSSDHESSIGSRVNIQQKLQEKKQQQLQELKEIEEEIKQGKLKRPHLLDIGEQDTLRQPIPPSKKQPWARPESPCTRPPLYHSLLGPYLPNGLRPKTKQRSQTPEILLIPENLEKSNHYYDYDEPRSSYLLSPPHHLEYPRTFEGCSSNNASIVPVATTSTKNKLCPRTRHPGTVRDNPLREQQETPRVLPKSPYQVPSDLDSQISLPRSYTLPREFRYYRRPRPRKPIRTEHFVPSNNSSDGDVDSADDNVYVPFPSHRVIGQIKLRPYQQSYRVPGQLHETKL